jgi:hypothetical protein
MVFVLLLKKALDLSRDLHAVQLDVHLLCLRVRVLSLVVDVLLPVVDDLSPDRRKIFNRKEFFLIKISKLFK